MANETGLPQYEVSRLEPSEVDRLFAHATHEDNLFNERLNFFAVFESVLVASASALFGSNQLMAGRLVVFFAALGVVTTLVWLWTQHRQRMLLNVLVRRLERHAPEFRQTRLMARGPDEVGEEPRHNRALSSLKLLAYGIPSGVLVMWLVILGVVLYKHRGLLFGFFRQIWEA